jgi:hypothetical protein
MGLTSAIGIQRVRSKGRRADQTAKAPILARSAVGPLRRGICCTTAFK